MARSPITRRLQRSRRCSPPRELGGTLELRPHARTRIADEHHGPRGPPIGECGHRISFRRRKGTAHHEAARLYRISHRAEIDAHS